MRNGIQKEEKDFLKSTYTCILYPARDGRKAFKWEGRIIVVAMRRKTLRELKTM